MSVAAQYDHLKPEEGIETFLTNVALATDQDEVPATVRDARTVLLDIRGELHCHRAIVSLVPFSAGRMY